MDSIKQDPPNLNQASRWRDRQRLIINKLKYLLLFAAGIMAAMFGLLIYGALNPSPQPLSIKDVNKAVAQALASATPAPAFSSQVYRIIQPSLVLIQSKGKNTTGEEENSLGSGVLISEQGEILTALHVVDNTSEIQVTFADGTRSNAQVVMSQPENDIAVLQPDKLPDILIPAVMGNPNAMQVGDEAYVVGNPYGLFGSMSAGVISGFNRSFQTKDSDIRIEGLIQIDTAVNPGNSGGPLLNRRGQVIGIIIGILNPTEKEFFIGIGFAVPITTAGGAAGVPQY